MEDTVISRILQLLHINSQLWRCPTCGKLKRTLGSSREGIPPLCLHQYTAFETNLRSFMESEDRDERSSAS